MQKKTKLICSLIYLLFLILSNTNFRVAGAIINDFTYSDSISVGSEFSWEVAKFKLSQDFEWEVKSGITIEQGDTIKFVITEDPDNLVISNLTDLFHTDVEWANVYLNDQSLGNDFTDLNLNFTENDEISTIDLFILPTTLVLDSGSEDTFDYFYDLLEPEQFDNETGYLEVSKTDDLITMGWRYYEEGVAFFIGTLMKEEYIIESSYNLETGVLDKLVVDFRIDFAGYTYRFDCILLNSESTQRAAINWIPIITGIAVIPIVIRKRRKK